VAIKHIQLQTKRNDVVEGQRFSIQLKMVVVELKSFQESHITAVEVRRAKPGYMQLERAVGKNEKFETFKLKVRAEVGKFLIT